MKQIAMRLDGACAGPLFQPISKVRPPVRPLGKAGVIHRGQTRRATPPWLSPLEQWTITTFYSRARLRTQLSGELWVVDHIVPKISPFVCGLHVPWNLRVIHWRENARKGNNTWPDMPAAQEELF